MMDVKEDEQLGVSVNEELAEELSKQVIKRFKRRKIYTRLKDNIWAADSAEIKLLFCFNLNVKNSLCVIDACTKYAWVKPFKNKKAKTAFDDFIEIVNISMKLWVHQRKELHNSFIQKWLDGNDSLMCPTHNEGKSVERFIKTSDNKFIKNDR